MNTALLLPVFVQVALAFFLLFRTGLGRVAETKQSPSLVRRAAADASQWSEKNRQTANNYMNQFEMPILFFVVIGFALILNLQNAAFLPLAWAFVIARLVHTFIHITSNNVLQRFIVFIIGILILMAMWIILALGVI